MAKEKKIKIVCNSSAIIGLSFINRMDLIKKLYQKIIIPRSVYEELVIKGIEKENVSGIKVLLDNNIIEVQEARDGGLIRALRRNLDYGESEVIALALEIEADLVILDEKDARDVAEMYSLKKIGFLGILIKAKERGFIMSVKKYLDQVIEAGFRIDKKLYESIIKSINEE